MCLGAEYDITSRKNPRVRHLKTLGESAAYRRQSGEYLCDGLKLLEEAVKWGADVREVLTDDKIPFELPRFTRVYSAPREIVDAASPMKTPQGVVFSVGMPKDRVDMELRGAVILENIQDPGNVGTVLRTANAFGIPAVYLVGECADLYNPKTVRATMGAIFRQRVAELTLEELRELSKVTPVYGAALRKDAVDIRKLDLSGAAVAIGNEGSGLSEELLELCAGTVIIPMSPRCESLNAAVAASVAMWEMSRDRL